MKKNKSVIVLISVILILAIVGIFAYLYLATDIFRSDKELFAKYFGQNEIIVEKLANLKVIDSYKNLENENKYESNIDINVKHSEGGNISNPLNDLNVKVDIQKDNEYHYANARLLYKEAEYVQAEFIKEQDIYGVRFADAFQQFITVENDEDFDEIIEDIGIDIESVSTIIDIYKEQKNSNYSEILSLKDKYVNLISEKIAEGQFSKQKNALITYNNNTINTNSYTVYLSEQQVENIVIEILNNIKNETQILEKTNIKDEFVNLIDEELEKINENSNLPEVKITVYEYGKNTIRTSISIGEYEVIIDNTSQGTDVSAKIKFSYLNDEEVSQIEMNISKNNIDNEEKMYVTVNIVEGDENYYFEFTILTEMLQNQIKMNTEISYIQDITSVTLKIENDINIGMEFQKSQTLDNQNSKLINSIRSEKRKALINQIQNIVRQKFTERLETLRNEMYKVDELEKEEEISQTEINKFNAKFEFYTGEEVSAESLKLLLEIIKNNIDNYEFINNDNAEENGDKNIEKLNVKINIKKDNTDEKAIEKMLEKINMNKKYNISIKYNEKNGLINYITIVEI